MVDRVGGFRRNTRHKMSKNVRKRGKISIRAFLQSFKIGEKVLLNAEPAYQKGMYCLRFHGKVGIIKKKLRTNYEVSITDGGKKKTLIVHPVHLTRIQK